MLDSLKHTLSNERWIIAETIKNLKKTDVLLVKLGEQIEEAILTAEDKQKEQPDEK